VRLWEVGPEIQLTDAQQRHYADEWIQEWAVRPTSVEDWQIVVERAHIIVLFAKHVFATQYKCKEDEIFRAYVAGFRRRLETDRGPTMRREVYARGEPRVSCDQIATVVTREHGRPRRPHNNSEQEAAYRGQIINDPTALLAEIANQVETEATARVPDAVEDLYANCPWRTHVPPQDPYAPALLQVLLGPYGRHIFSVIVAR